MRRLTISIVIALIITGAAMAFLVAVILGYI
jgi:hypothetical protein